MRRFQQALLLCLALFVFAPGSAYAVERFAVLIGANRGDADDPDLRFAESDAERMYSVLKEVGGFYPENLLLIRGEPAPVVERALISMNARLRSTALSAGNQVMLLVYYSGHGDAEALHLNRTKLELQLVEQLVRSSAAAFRILIVDACRSGALTRVKGGTFAPSFNVVVDPALNGEGLVFLTSSSANEDAQESDALGGSFFTHYLRSGLLGPADEDLDGRVTLDEAYHYAYTNTLRASSRSLSGTQHPTFRYELRGQGKLVLSEPHRYQAQRGMLEFPPNGSYLLFERSANGKVVGEIGAMDRNRRLSVPAGTYFVRGRRSAYLLEGTVALESGKVLTIEDSQLERIAYARLTRKGAGSQSAAHGPEAGYSFRSPLRNATSYCHGFFVGYAFATPSISLAPRFEYCRDGFSNQWVTATIDAFDLGLRAAHTWDVHAWSLELGVDVGANLSWQRLESERPSSNRTTLGGYFGAGLGLGYDLGKGVTLLAESSAETYVYRLRATQTNVETTAASLIYRQRLGVVRYW